MKTNFSVYIRLAFENQVGEKDMSAYLLINVRGKDLSILIRENLLNCYITFKLWIIKNHENYEQASKFHSIIIRKCWH